MRREIERRFLLADEDWRAADEGSRIVQGYLSTDPARTVRVRLTDSGAWLTIKGPTVGAERIELEFPIPTDDARVLLDELCLRPLIEKTRHVVDDGGVRWEVDVFHGDNDGLVLAEVELEDPAGPERLPAWVGAEITGDHRYANASLVGHPYRRWRREGP